ncbi:hypothetical protein CMO83_02870 [Candidatus Woesearchaeota archaeon]|mgnify:CR=1|jgi:hypothetical protein|nr:hypothetical protein [Candidatus Woesearchaeota archaeon]|tara:strand:+ start:8531 stop:9196 length:666 start_codon:yes stop_codon:yes gene_type:complete
MANGDILSGLNQSDINHFRKDFIQMMKVGVEIDRCYGKADTELDDCIPNYKELIEKFNKKYKGIRIKPKITIEHFHIRIFVKAKSLKSFFENAASRIPGLKSVGRTNFNQVDVTDVERFASFVASLQKKVYLSYIDPESGTSTLTASLDKKEKIVEIIYNADEIINENSAAFKICAFYAAKQSINKKIEIYGDASTFGFSNLLDEVEQREWHDKYDPKYLE